MEKGEGTLRVGFIGAGNMAFAIAKGLINDGMLRSENIYASAPSMVNLSKMKDLGCNVTHDNSSVIKACYAVILCVKPHLAVSVLQDLQGKDCWNERKLIISVISGIQINALESYFPEGTPVIRGMPNIPISVSAGAFAFCCGKSATLADAGWVKELFIPLGLCEEVPENLLNVVCGLSGSGPAYVYTVIQAMSDGAVKMGLPRYLATKFAAQAVMGAAKMVLETGKHPDVLRDEVCSPAGTTISGLHCLERGGVRASFIDAVEAATLKAKEQSEFSK